MNLNETICRVSYPTYSFRLDEALEHKDRAKLLRLCWEVQASVKHSRERGYISQEECDRMVDFYDFKHWEAAL